jgi:hypothetical protein
MSLSGHGGARAPAPPPPDPPNLQRTALAEGLLTDPFASVRIPEVDTDPDPPAGADQKPPPADWDIHYQPPNLYGLNERLASARAQPQWRPDPTLGRAAGENAREAMAAAHSGTPFAPSTPSSQWRTGQDDGGQDDSSDSLLQALRAEPHKLVDALRKDKDLALKALGHVFGAHHGQ